jgi:hypothetical protein
MLAVLAGFAIAASPIEARDIDLFPEHVLAPTSIVFPAKPLTSQQRLGKIACWTASAALTGVAIGFKMAALEAEHDAKSNENEYIEEQEFYFDKAEKNERIARTTIGSGVALGAIGGGLHYMDKQSAPPPPPEKPAIREMPEISMEEDDMLKDGKLEGDLLEEPAEEETESPPDIVLEEDDFPEEPE